MSKPKPTEVEKPKPRTRKKKADAATPATERVLVLRTCAADMTSHNGFVWPTSGPVSCPDWLPTEECGNGLHGWLWGEGDYSLGNWASDAKWLVVAVDPALIVDLNGKVKFPRGEVVFCGDRIEAPKYLYDNGGKGHRIIGGTATAGDRGTATAGDRGTATAGDRGTATAGDSGTATAGDSGTATAGDSGTATAGDSGTATAGEDGVISVQWYDSVAEKYRRAIGVIGENGLLPNVPYRLDDQGKWVAVAKGEEV